jgi:hypothetical protein
VQPVGEAEAADPGADDDDAGHEGIVSPGAAERLVPEDVRRDR